MLPNIIFGAVAGTIGVIATDKVGWHLYRREETSVREQEKEARIEGLDTAHAVANKAAGLVGKKLTPAQPHPAGIAVHYALGILPAVLLAIYIKRYPHIGLWNGTVYGIALFAANDELMAPALRTAARPTKYPWQAHARGLVSHLVLGVTTVITLRALQGLHQSEYASSIMRPATIESDLHVIQKS